MSVPVDRLIAAPEPVGERLLERDVAFEFDEVETSVAVDGA